MTAKQIDWQPQFETGIASVDHEHRALIDGINRFLAMLDEGGGGGAAEREAALGEIFADISAHFALEERKMAVMGYGALAEHKADHERLLDELRDIMDDLEAAGAPGADLPDRLRDWFTVHFSTHDARLHGAE